MIEKRDGQASDRLPVPMESPAAACQPEPLVTLHLHDRGVIAGVLAFMVSGQQAPAGGRLPAGVLWAVFVGFTLAAIAFARNRMLAAAVLVIITLMIAGVAALVLRV
jgi:CHASE2 domain-containing sensor protein